MEAQEKQQEITKTMAETLEILRKAMGIETIVGPGNTEAYVRQAEATATKIEEQQ